jgi:hypothetical protein
MDTASLLYELTLTRTASNDHQKLRFRQRRQRGSALVCHTLCCRSYSHRFVHFSRGSSTSNYFPVIVAIISDRLRLRGVVMLFTLPIAIIGYAAIANINSPRVQYGMTFLMATGQYASVPCILVWLSNNSAGHYKRATTSAMQLAIANAGGFVASMLPSSNALNDYSQYLSIQLSISRWTPVPSRTHYYPRIVGIRLVYVSIPQSLPRRLTDRNRTLLNVLYCAKINRDKKKGKYDQYAGYHDDRNPEFMMVL